MIVKILILVAVIILLLFGAMAFTGAPYVPSKPSDLKKAFQKLYPLGPNDLLLDLGAGDGVVLKIATDSGARAIGVELNPIMVFLARLRLKNRDAEVIRGNYYHLEFPKSTTVVYTFGDSRDMDKLYRKVQSEATRLNKTLHFISYAFSIKGVKPVKKSGAYFLYRVPPKKS